MYFSFSFFTWFWDYLWVHQACFSFRKWKWIYSLNGNRLPKPVQEHRMHANVQNIISPYVFPHDYDLVQLFFIYLASSLLHQWLHLPKQESKKLSKQNMLKQIHPTVRICTVPTWAYLSPFSSLLCSQEKVLIEKLGEHFKKQIRKMQIMTFPTMTIRCKNHFLWA